MEEHLHVGESLLKDWFLADGPVSSATPKPAEQDTQTKGPSQMDKLGCLGSF